MSNDNGIYSFLKAASENEAAILESEKELVALLVEVDRAFQTLNGQLVNGDVTGAMLLFNAHASFLAAVRIALSGQSPPTFMAMRGCIESALYALIAADDKSNAAAWLNRNNDKKRCKEIFKPYKAFQILKSKDPNLAVSLQEVYDLSIDFGAHPNMLSVVHHLTFKDEESGVQPVQLAILNNVDSITVTRTLLACVEMAIPVLWIFPQVLPGFAPAIEVHSQATIIRQQLEKWRKSQNWRFESGSG